MLNEAYKDHAIKKKLCNGQLRWDDTKIKRYGLAWKAVVSCENCLYKSNQYKDKIRFVVSDAYHSNYSISMLASYMRMYYKMQVRSSVANGAAYPTCLTTVYALTNILFVGFGKKKEAYNSKERKEGKWGKIL